MRATNILESIEIAIGAVVDGAGARPLGLVLQLPAAQYNKAREVVYNGSVCDLNIKGSYFVFELNGIRVTIQNISEGPIVAPKVKAGSRIQYRKRGHNV
jgi:hypothetical protein